MKKILLFTLFCYCFDWSFAQLATKMTGTVIDSIGHPLQYATIALFKEKKEKVISMTYTDSKGKFLITHSNTGEHWLQVSLEGYEVSWNRVMLNKEDMDVGSIILKTSIKELQGVTVTNTKRLVSMREDGISYNAENDPMANSEKALDLLKKTPMVSVDGNGKVMINGQTSFRVLVNGRETAQFARDASEALKNYPGSIIKRIDIITNPSAKYDAEGVGGLINIITKKNVIGYNASVDIWNNYFNPFDWSSNVARGGNMTFNMKKDKVGLVVGLLYDGNQNFIYRENETIRSLSGAAFSKRTSTGISQSSTYSPEGNWELTYEIDSMNAISIYGTFDRTRNESDKSRLFTLEGNPSTTTIQSDFLSVQNQKSIDLSSGIDYIKKFKSNPAKEFTIKLYGVFGDNDLRNTSAQYNSTGSDRFILNDNISSDKQYTIQTDYILPGKNKRILEIGAKAILRRAISDYQSYIKSTASGTYQPNPLNSDNFNYHQNVYSTYASKSFTSGRLNFRIGLRMEHTVINGNFISTGTAVQQSYTRWLPNFLVGARTKNGSYFSFSYSQRLNRPYVNALNPFVNNIDSLNVSTGNPNLGPQLSHVMNFQYRLSGKKIFTTFSLGYNFSNSYIIYGYFFNKSTGVTTFQPQNGGTSRIAFLNIGLNATPSKSVRLNFNGNISYLRIASPSLGQQTNQGFSGQTGTNGSYEIGSKLTATWFANYYFPVLLLQGNVNAYYAYGFGSRYIISKGKLFASVSINNLFNKRGEFLRIREFADANFASEVKTFNRFRGVTMSLTWNFGKLDQSVSKKKGVSNTDLL
jgi:outer membrane receptor protein involved in Fe transport